MHKINAFEEFLMVCCEDISLDLTSFPPCPWTDYLLNPRRLRGSDFLMRWSQGVWSEQRLVDAVNSHGEFYALPYGPSSVAPENDVRAFELYFERLDAANLSKLKRPDLLIFKADDRQKIDAVVAGIGGEKELPFTSEDDPRMRAILAKAVIAVECENSLWVAEKMPAFGRPLKPMSRLGGQHGLSKSAVVPTIIIKEEDREPLRRWEQACGVPIHVWQVFFDRAFGIAFSDAEKLFAKKLILPTIQVFQAPSGPSSSKPIYKIYYHHAYALGKALSFPDLVATYIEDKNGHILPYVKFQGGALALDQDALNVVRSISQQ